ncbi:MAG: adenylate/guanylate cyclase domain-containing protein [Alphaproteobacteria bacterium]|nr:adenylate/guanylate cyclase domain-containing protein [Alphaproteobacteria bacterium]MDE2630260.1 adenylate/guanylate cyclase domain-containing protein [Alphaproteobacteria bacterium]
MSLRNRPIAIWAFPLVMLAVALFVLGADAGGIASRLRGILFDGYQASLPRTYEDTGSRSGHPVRVLDIDAASTVRFGAWPWPHAALAQLVGALKAQGASIVVFVDPLDNTDPASPKNLLALVPPGPTYDAARTALDRMPSPDDALASALTGVKTVTGFALGDARPARTLMLKATVGWSGARDPFGRVRAFDQASASLAAIEAASAGVGAVNLDVDSDGKVRRMPLVFRLRDKAVPSLDAEVLRLAEGKDAITLKSDEGNGGLFGGTPVVAAVDTGRGELATAPDGSLWIAYSGVHPERNVDASALIDKTLAPDSLRGAIVYIGAPDDLVDTPTALRAVAEVHAEAAENLLLGVALRRPAAAAQAELLCLALFGLGCVLVFARLGMRWAGLFVLGTIAGVSYVSWRLYAGEHVLFDALGLNLGLAAVWLTGAGARWSEIARSRNKLRLAFADALPARTIDQIARNPQLMKLEGESRTVSYLACGVRGFAELATSFRGDPAAFTRLMQRVLEPLINVALDHGGTIDKLTTEGFTAFWNAPLDDLEHAIHACEAANAMMETIARTNEIITHERRIDGVALSPVEIGIGVSTGPAIAGGFKAHGRTAYSVHGDCTVLAARIQQISGQYGPAVIVSEETRKSSERGFAFLEVDYIALAGHDEPVKLYAMLGNPVMRASPKFRALATFHDHIFQSLRAQQWQKARELIEQCRKLSGASQKLYDLHLTRVAYFEDNPPSEDWDGAFRPILK